VTTKAPLGTYEIETASGGYLDLLSPDPDAIRLEDVAHGLANTCRFAGQASRFYSVAEHAVLVADKLHREGRPDLALVGLHHDDAEAYLGDVTRPLKLALDGEWRAIEANMTYAIWRALEVGAPPWAEGLPEPVKATDDWALLIEAAEFLPSKGRGWRVGPPPWALERPPWWYGGVTPQTAEALWLKRHRELTA
jgi:hypothetical protein